MLDFSEKIIPLYWEIKVTLVDSDEQQHLSI